MNQALALVLTLITVGTACGKSAGATDKATDKATDQDGARPPPFDVKIHKVEHKSQVAPNKTYEEQGLATKAPAGSEFLCVQFEATNTTAEPESLPPPVLIDDHGAKLKLSIDATASYMPADWKEDSTVALGQMTVDKLPPKQPFKQKACFAVAPDLDAHAQLELENTGWGRTKPWKLDVKSSVP